MNHMIIDSDKINELIKNDRRFPISMPLNEFIKKTEKVKLHDLWLTDTETSIESFDIHEQCDIVIYEDKPTLRIDGVIKEKFHPWKKHTLPDSNDGICYIYYAIDGTYSAIYVYSLKPLILTQGDKLILHKILTDALTPHI